MEFITLTDEVIRTMLRDYKLKHLKNPSLITVNEKTGKELHKIYVNHNYDLTDEYLFGIPIFVREQNEALLLYNKVI